MIYELDDSLITSKPNLINIISEDKRHIWTYVQLVHPDFGLEHYQTLSTLICAQYHCLCRYLYRRWDQSQSQNHFIRHHYLLWSMLSLTACVDIFTDGDTDPKHSQCVHFIPHHMFHSSTTLSITLISSTLNICSLVYLEGHWIIIFVYQGGWGQTSGCLRRNLSQKRSFSS